MTIEQRNRIRRRIMRYEDELQRLEGRVRYYREQLKKERNSLLVPQVDT